MANKSAGLQQCITSPHAETFQKKRTSPPRCLWGPVSSPCNALVGQVSGRPLGPEPTCCKSARRTEWGDNPTSLWGRCCRCPGERSGFLPRFRLLAQTRLVLTHLPIPATGTPRLQTANPSPELLTFLSELKAVSSWVLQLESYFLCFLKKTHTQHQIDQCS